MIVAMPVASEAIASPFVEIFPPRKLSVATPNRYNKVKIWNFFLFTSLVKTVLKPLT